MKHYYKGKGSGTSVDATVHCFSEWTQGYDATRDNTILLVSWIENHPSSFKCGILNIFLRQNNKERLRP